MTRQDDLDPARGIAWGCLGGAALQTALALLLFAFAR